MFTTAVTSATAAVVVALVAALSIPILLPVPSRRRVLLRPTTKTCVSHRIARRCTLHNLHFILSPLLGLLPLRRLVPLVVVILFTAALADHLLPVAESPLLLRRPTDCIAVAVTRLVVQSIRFFVLLVGARPLACLRLLVVAVVLVLYISITAPLI